MLQSGQKTLIGAYAAAKGNVIPMVLDAAKALMPVPVSNALWTDLKGPRSEEQNLLLDALLESNGRIFGLSLFHTRFDIMELTGTLATFVQVESEKLTFRIDTNNSNGRFFEMVLENNAENLANVVFFSNLLASRIVT